MDEVEPFNHCAVRPAAAEVRLTVEPVVERTREVKVFGDERLDGAS
jgi:hypothetical protein